MNLVVHEYQDTVCLDLEDTCAADFPFYVIFKQEGMYKHEDGVVGIAPIPIGGSSGEGPSFIEELVKQKRLRMAIVSIYISKYPDEVSSNILLGDFDPSVVEGGDDGMVFYDITNDTDWQVDLTEAYFGNTMLFHHTFLPTVIYSGSSFVGLMDRDFKQIATMVQDLDGSIYCDEKNCFGKNECSYYSDIIPDYTFTLARFYNYTLSGSNLMEHPGDDYTCQFALYNSGQQYILGEYFLKDYYSVYDLRDSKIGLGKVKDLHPLHVPGYVDPFDH
jgi:hypothetical protein